MKDAPVQRKRKKNLAQRRKGAEKREEKKRKEGSARGLALAAHAALFPSSSFPLRLCVSARELLFALVCRDVKAQGKEKKRSSRRDAKAQREEKKRKEGKRR
jgi:hypothetical protein